MPLAGTRRYPRVCVVVSLISQLLNFFRMSFVLFSLAAFLATVVLMPLNLFVSLSSASAL